MADIEIKTRILNHAAEKYYALGISKVSIDEIASELAMSKKTLYEFFPSKRALLAAVVQLIGIRMEKEFEQLRSSGMSIERKVIDSILVIGDVFGKISPQFILDLQRFEPELWKQIEEIRHRQAGMYLGELFEEAKQKNIFRKDVDAKLFYLAYVTSIRNIVNSKSLSENSFSAQEASGGILKLLIDGALTSDARAHSSVAVDVSEE